MFGRCKKHNDCCTVSLGRRATWLLESCFCDITIRWCPYLCVLSHHLISELAAETKDLANLWKIINWVNIHVFNKKIIINKKKTFDRLIWMDLWYFEWNKIKSIRKILTFAICVILPTLNILILLQRLWFKFSYFESTLVQNQFLDTLKSYARSQARTRMDTPYPLRHV